MRLFSYDKPKIKVQKAKADGFSGWLKCSSCGEMIHASELGQNFNCCPKCEYHYRVSAQERIGMLIDQDTWTPLFSDLQSIDVLSFEDTDSYKNRLAKARTTSQESEGIIVGTGNMEQQKVALAIMDFNFMAGSMGSVVGEKLTRLIELAIEQRIPLIIVSASGGARMQESIFSLMQMAKTSAALSRLHAQRIPYISVLTNPTSGGVTASFASLGDVIVAEPKALICFAGPRVVAQVVGEDLPEGAQKSEFLLERGMIDKIVSRKELRKELSCLLSFMTYGLDRENKQNQLDSTIEELFLLTEEND